MRTFLIDGYNLLHAVGLVASKRAGRFEKARTRLLDWIADADPVKAGTARVRVVFDAQNGTGDAGEKPHRAGVWVRFAYKQTADDLIETLLASEHESSRVVVSNDTRLQDAARRRGAAAWTCEAFTDWLLTGTPGPGVSYPDPPAPAPEKPDGPAPPDERDALLLAFQVPKKR